MRRFLAGDEQAFDRLYDRHAPAMYQFALRLVGGREPDAEDVVQEAWLRAADRLSGFGWKSRLRTWLMGFTLNCAREWLRNERRPANPGGAGAGGPRPGGPRSGDPRQAHVPPNVADLDLERAISSLEDDLRFVLVLHDLEGHTHTQVGERLGIAEGTSKSRLSRARSQVRAALSGGGAR